MQKSNRKPFSEWVIVICKTILQLKGCVRAISLRLILGLSLSFVFWLPLFAVATDSSLLKPVFENPLPSVFPIDIPAGSVVEGSFRKDGIQPDYIIDIDDPVFTPLKEFVQKEGESEIEYWKKIKRITDYIRYEVLPLRAYNQPEYLAMVSEYLNEKRKIPLSAYVRLKVGVCRESAMILHHALLWAKIPNKFAYASIRMRYFAGGARPQWIDMVEDHAFVVVDYNERKWVVDAYNSLFNGFAVDDLMSRRGAGQRTEGLLPRYFVKTDRWIVKFHDFPRIYTPGANRCAAVWD